jgi:hypothetical protein
MDPIGSVHVDFRLGSVSFPLFWNFGVYHPRACLTSRANPRSVSPERTFDSSVLLTMPLVVDNGEQRILNDDDDRIPIPPSVQSVPGVTHSYSSNGLVLGTVGNGHDSYSNGLNDFSGYTVMVAGQRSGKTSFLRLLLDTSEISSTATKDQLASVAKFVQGCSGHTSHIRTASINIDHDIDQNSTPQVLTLTLVDTPSLTFEDEASTERAIHEILRHVESRFADGIEDVSFSKLISYFILNLHFFLSRSGDPQRVTTTSICALLTWALSRRATVN